MPKTTRPQRLIKLWRFLQRPDLLFYLLLYFMALLIAGTVAQKWMGLFPATKMFFNSFVIWYGILPLPAGATILGLVFINLLVHFIVKSRWTLSSFGNNLAHLSVLILLLGGAAALAYKQEGFLLLAKGQPTANIYQSDEDDFLKADSKPVFTLPFTVTLNALDDGYYPGTDVAQYYLSAIDITDGNHTASEYIAMNDPLRYRGYTFYQSSVLTLPDQQRISVLSVVYNPGWLFPYLATALLFLGLAFHAGVKIRERR